VTDLPGAGDPDLAERRLTRELRRQQRQRQILIRRLVAAGVLAALALGIAGIVALASGGGKSPSRTRAKGNTPAKPSAPSKPDRALPVAIKGAINPKVPGLTTFRGNLTRTYYGEGPVPRHPVIRWRYPPTGGMCAQSSDEHGTETWCGVGWTGQPNVIPHKKSGLLELRFGAYDDHYHFLNARTGKPIKSDLVTGDLAKGSATSDPDGYPLYYAGSRDNNFRIIALDRPQPTVLWSVNADTSVSNPVWNNDWDGAALVVGDYLLEGGENSWFYVIKLNRGYSHGRVSVNPQIVLTVPSWDSQLSSEFPGTAFSVENSVAYRKGVVYFANSAGLVQGWDISKILHGGSGARRVFRFWTGDDTDASVVIDHQGFLYVASELEKYDSRSSQIGQLMKLNPFRKNPVVWSLPVRQQGIDGAGGIWSTPALDRGMLYVAINAGGLLAVDRKSGKVRWKIPLPGPTWSSPVVVDNVLLEGDCSGVLHAYDVSRAGRKPAELWKITLGGCIEATPAVWKGMIWVGTRGGAMYGIGEAKRARARGGRGGNA
jgi:outer membrane protein assembly factor BamB